MLIIPAIDLKGGRCVRLWQGKKDKETVYSENPLVAAKLWAKKGAKRLHIVDLDGAFEGKPVHLEVAGKIASEVEVPLEFGGGIRNEAILNQVFEKGIDYAILGTRGISPDFVKSACGKFGSRIIVSIDARQSKVVLEGWEKETSLKPRDLARNLANVGVKTIIFTDTTRDGTLQGVNIKLIQDFARGAGVDVIIAGGISSLEDIEKVRKLKALGVTGIIIGKALYEGKIKLEEAIKLSDREKWNF